MSTTAKSLIMPYRKKKKKKARILISFVMGSVLVIINLFCSYKFISIVNENISGYVKYVSFILIVFFAVKAISNNIVVSALDLKKETFDSIFKYIISACFAAALTIPAFIAYGLIQAYGQYMFAAILVVASIVKTREMKIKAFVVSVSFFIVLPCIAFDIYTNVSSLDIPFTINETIEKTKDIFLTI